VGEWDKFKEHVLKYGRTIQTLQSDYEQLTGTRVRQLDKKVEKVLQYSGNTLLDEVKKEPELTEPAP
jgi:DNA anti-recombination protein RmuC